MRSTVLLSCSCLLAAAAIAPVFSQSPRPNSTTPIATADGTLDRVRVEVTELKRTTGETLTLRFTIVNESSRPLQVSDVGISDGALITPTDGAAYTIGGVHLIDPVGKKKYFVVRDSAGACVCSKFSAVPAGSRGNHWARFPAPPNSVERMSIVIPSFAPLDDVPVSR